MRKELITAVEAAIAAGRAIMEIYESDSFEVEYKEDESPLTLADKTANEIISEFLIPTKIPIISEESQQLPYEKRKDWESCWIVDPLDGTKEFIKRNGEFTVNIALTIKGRPEIGVIYAPALNVLYFGVVSMASAYKTSLPHNNLLENVENAERIYPAGLGEYIKVVGSRSHMNDETLSYIKELEEKYGKEVEIVSKGSSLKFCLVAEGSAHIYPRYAPTMEWDTAAGQAICEAVGLKCLFRETRQPMTYNRVDLLNPHFLVSDEG